ncbi:MAG: dynamin family protein [Scytonema hyalinum WJT4-NPBG1]|jgi:GTPase SAR1 family protein|nr:dynamin family protein [Scytonema hyalinum WJT4-NPBG1]
MNNNNIEELLKSSLTNLLQLGELIEYLIKTYPYPDDLKIKRNPDDLKIKQNNYDENKSIKEIYIDFDKTYKEAVERLKKPSLSIAMIGTTSSGKSTIVNALIGRKIAPIEAQETSAGILTLKHSNSPDSELVIESTKNAKWKPGKQIGLSDESLYKQIRDDIMRLYHKERKTKEDIEAPRVTAFVELLPVCDPSLLGLPPGVDVEFIDLPGLKSTTDNQNLEVIQQKVNKAFSIVALDYLQVDDKQRQTLLQELKTTIEYQRGRTDSIIFILNKVNLATANDIPLQQRISELKKEIKSILPQLDKSPEIIPFNSLLLYYVQCAWGSRPLNQLSLVEPLVRLDFLKAMIKDSFSIILDKTKNELEVESWILNLRSQVINNKPINDETIRELLKYALDWTGGKELWDTLRNRVHSSFPQLVLFPILSEVFIKYDELEKKINYLTTTRQISTKADIKQQQETIYRSRDILPKSIKEINDKFTNKIQTKIKLLKEATTPEKLSFLVDSLQQEGFKGFQPLIETFNEVEGDLTRTIILPVREALNKNKSAEQLKEHLALSINPALVDKIISTYVFVNQILSEFPSTNGQIEITLRKDDTRTKEKLKKAESDFHYFYILMGKALSERAGFVLQGQVEKIEFAIKSLIDNQKNELNNLLQITLKNRNLEEAIDKAFEKKAHRNDCLCLPNELFNLNATVNRNETQKEEIIGQETVTEPVRKCWIFVDEQKQRRPIKKNIDYSTLILPNAETTVKEWSQGIIEKKQEIWDIICKWMINCLQQSSRDFEISALEVTKLADTILAERLHELENNLGVQKEYWNKIESKLTESKIFRNKLGQQCLKQTIDKK